MEERELRKARSIAVLKRERVPFIEDLPMIETEAESRSRSVEEVALRAMSLLVVAAKGEGLTQEEILGMVQELGVQDALSPEEAAFVGDPDASHDDRMQLSWRYEGVWVMLWALGFVRELKRPDAQCDVPWMASLMRKKGASGLVKEGRLRPAGAILDAADLIYRYHWAVRDAYLAGRDIPAGLDPGVVQERHRALNWLIGCCGEAGWDDVDVST